MLNIFLLLILIVLLIYIIHYDPIPILPKHPNTKPLKCAILLTMYVKGREQLYSNIVYQWLNKTNLDIFIVDSSNQGLPITHPRLKYCIFEQNVPFVNYNPSIYEVNSILNAFKHFKMFENYDMVIKVTGKYFIPNFNLTNIPADADIIVQKQRDTSFQNTELFAAKPHLFYNIFQKYNKKMNLEQYISYLYLQKFKMYRFNAFKLDQSAKRGDGRIITYL